ASEVVVVDVGLDVADGRLVVGQAPPGRGDVGQLPGRVEAVGDVGGGGGRAGHAMSGRAAATTSRSGSRISTPRRRLSSMVHSRRSSVWRWGWPTRVRPSERSRPTRSMYSARSIPS